MIRKPTLNEKRILESVGLDPGVWLVRKNCREGIALQHRHTAAKKLIPRGLIKE